MRKKNMEVGENITLDELSNELKSTRFTGACFLKQSL